MDRWVGKVALVTGAGAGIGLAITEKLVEQDITVVGLDIDQKKLDDLSTKLSSKKGQFYPIKGDVSNESDIIDAFKWIKNNLGGVHILINNAAVGYAGMMSDGDAKNWQKTLQVNVIGLSIATREALKDMKNNNVDGHIINLNSITGHKISNYVQLGIYPASKHAVTALTEMLRLELVSLKSKIKVTSISPGLVDTETARNELKAEIIQTSPLLKPEDIADAVSYILSTPPHVQVHELIIKPVGEII